jgi:sarcosine oxidase
MQAIWEPRAGILFPELAVQTHLELAEASGATLGLDEPVKSWEPQGSGVRVITPKGQYLAQHLLLSAGAWLRSLIPDLNLPLSVERQVLCWFEPASSRDLFRPEACPIFIVEYASSRFFYGFPDLGEGVKVAIHHEGQITDPGSICRDVSTEETETVRTLLRRFLPAADVSLKSSAVCMYTNTPDEHFILDPPPDHSQVLIVSPCSGHGFKFAP